jgi:hypothetical protein
MSHVDDGALHAYLDGELTPVERARLDAHVAECPACRGRLDEERGLIERASRLLGMAQPPERAAPPPLHQLRQPRLVWRLRTPLAWAATVVLAVGIGYYAGVATVGRHAPVATLVLADSPASVTAPPSAPAPGEATALSRPMADAGRQLAARAPRATAERARADVRAREEKADGNLAAAAGVVAIQPPSIRPVTPAPVPMAEAVVTQRESDVEAVRGRQVTTEWPVIRRDPARQVLGADPVGIPGLAVRNMRRSPAGDGVVLVEQILDSTTVIQLFQRRAQQVDLARGVVTRGAAPVARAAAQEVQAYLSTERLARFIGALRVEIAGPLTPDSLNKLLEQLKPIP